MGTKVLRAEGLAAIRADRLVFRDLSFTLAPGGALIVRGPNGAGKSTLLRLIAGLLPPAAGQLLWQGQDALFDPPLHAKRVAYLGHQDAIKPALTAAENLRFAAHCSGGSITDALAALNLVPLAELPARLFSAGQKRRLALARIALSNAPLWLLDEPTNALDEAAASRLASLIAAHRAKGGLVIAASHTPLPLPAAAELTLG
ncbi:MAG TPA: heme ABC exporter ATP-binding protein CcmA [Acetobacteraceae bacterium]|jgi:heme exporter protein A|nr:heme ABC exporter ATP-binding protein CcmA [Acetobacteraceae bacterium]